MLMRRVSAQGWIVDSAVVWKQIRKFRAGEHRDRETRNVLGLVQAAREAGCDVVAFVRDRDGSVAHPNKEREAQIEAGILQAASFFEGWAPRIIGGVAVEKLESWLLALAGKPRSEVERHPEAKLEALGIQIKLASEYVKVVENADLDRLPGDARSLRRWLDHARAALCAQALAP